MEPSVGLDRLARRVIGAAIEVHRVPGSGFLESFYEEALCVELTLRSIQFDRQVAIGVQYKGQRVGEARLDLLVDKTLLVDLKAVEGLAPIHVAQILSYLKAARLHLGLLISFNVTPRRRGIRRIIYNTMNTWRSRRLDGLSFPNFSIVDGRRPTWLRAISDRLAGMR